MAQSLQDQVGALSGTIADGHASGVINQHNENRRLNLAVQKRKDRLSEEKEEKENAGSAQRG
ncbi:MAG: hypothetical protein HBSIN02_12330 [Bacteroidia bacterium]|nr:MAG: hypothetical protein HBSIN02_12330 [Bacteroidia bacterium]